MVDQVTLSGLFKQRSTPSKKSNLFYLSLAPPISIPTTNQIIRIWLQKMMCTIISKLVLLRRMWKLVEIMMMIIMVFNRYLILGRRTRYRLERLINGISTYSKKKNGKSIARILVKFGQLLYRNTLTLRSSASSKVLEIFWNCMVKVCSN